MHPVLAERFTQISRNLPLVKIIDKEIEIPVSGDMLTVIKHASMNNATAEEIAHTIDTRIESL